jgi:hypothetical protein
MGAVRSAEVQRGRELAYLANICKNCNVWILKKVTRQSASCEDPFANAHT